MAVYNIDENLTPVLLSAMHTYFMSHLLVLVLVLVLRELGLGLGLGLGTADLLVLTTALEVLSVGLGLFLDRYETTTADNFHTMQHVCKTSPTRFTQNEHGRQMHVDL